MKILATVALGATIAGGAAWGQWTSGSGGAIYYNGGSVGIGTATPSTPLNVESILRVSNASVTGSRVDILGGRDGSNSSSIYIYSNSPSSPPNVYLGDGTYSSYLNANGGLLGIGTANPQAKLEVDGNFLLGGPLVGQGYLYSMQNQNLGIMSGNVGGAALIFSSGPISSPTEHMRIDGATGRVGIGTGNPQYPLSVNGTVQAKEVIVNSGWSDYVFDPSYRLMPLNQIATYIQANHHLPDIPAESEVREKGVSVGEMQSKLLAKIEELTLHMITAERDREQLLERVSAAERLNRDLQERLVRLEKEIVH